MFQVQHDVARLHSLQSRADRGSHQAESACLASYVSFSMNGGIPVGHHQRSTKIFLTVPFAWPGVSWKKAFNSLIVE